jgi:hypothetical protein
MQFFSSKQAMALGVALALIASGTSSYAQTTTPAEATTASAPPEAAPVPTPAPTPASAPVEVAPAVAKLNEIGAPPEGKGQIVFFRPSRFVGAAVSFSVREANTGIGKLTNGTYFVHVTDPGIKEYNISFEARDTLRMEVEAGETYYVIQSIAMGVIGARPNLTPSSEEAFQAKKLKVTKAKATDRKE